MKRKISQLIEEGRKRAERPNSYLCGHSKENPDPCQCGDCFQRLIYRLRKGFHVKSRYHRRHGREEFGRVSVPAVDMPLRGSEEGRL